MQLSSTVIYGQAWYCGSAEQEARSLLPLLRAAGQTVAYVLDLIRVTPEEEKLLHTFAAKFPELKSDVKRSLDYRLRVEKEFCRLAGDVGAFTLGQVITKNGSAACTNLAIGSLSHTIHT